MVLKYTTQQSWTDIAPGTISEYVLVTNPTKVEMAASSIYGTLPRAPKCHRRGLSEATIPAKYATYSSASAAPTKKSFFAGLAHKIKYAVDGKPNTMLHRRLNWSPSEDFTGSTGSLQNFSPALSRKNSERPQRLWTRGLESVYSSQRLIPSWRRSSHKKNSIKESSDLEGYSSTECSSSSAPSSPESQRSFLSGNPKRIRRSRASRKNEESGSISSSRGTLMDNGSQRNSFSSEDSKKSSNGCKLLVLGAGGVGKSALTVRFLTKRFIGEYAPEIESVYDQTMNVEGKDINVQLWDSNIPDIYQNSTDDDQTSDSSTISHSSSFTSSSSCRLSNRFSNSSLEDEAMSNNNKPCNQDNLTSMSRKDKLRRTINKKIRRWRNSEESESEGDSVNAPVSGVPTEAERRLRWADGIVVVYSICDKSSFESACDVIRFVRQTEAAEINRMGGNSDLSYTKIPVLLVGNKLDLEHRRRVSISDARSTAASYACASCELSVSESFEPVSEALRDHLKMIRKSSKQREAFKSKSRKGKW